MTAARMSARSAPLSASWRSSSFPEEQYHVLERIAAENKVSLAWVVRDAIDGYLRSNWPLFSRKAPTPKMCSREARAREKKI